MEGTRREEKRMGHVLGSTVRALGHGKLLEDLGRRDPCPNKLTLADALWADTRG